MSDPIEAYRRAFHCGVGGHDNHGSIEGEDRCALALAWKQRGEEIARLEKGIATVRGAMDEAVRGLLRRAGEAESERDTLAKERDAARRWIRVEHERIREELKARAVAAESASAAKSKAIEAKDAALDSASECLGCKVKDCVDCARVKEQAQRALAVTWESFLKPTEEFK